MHAKVQKAVEPAKEPHVASGDYVGCPHCGGPVYVGIQLRMMAADIITAILEPLPRGPLWKKLDSLARDLVTDAGMEREDTHPFSAIVAFAQRGRPR